MGDISEPFSRATLTDSSGTTGGCFPGANPMPAFWQEDIHELHNHRSTEELPASSDVVIIGGGYAGIGTAYHLAKGEFQESKLSVTVLEARGVCSGATGRNGGHLRPDMYGHIPKYMDRAGIEAGLEIAEFEVAHLDAIKKLIEKEKIDCDFTLTRSVDVWINEEAAIRAKALYDLMVSRNLAYMNDVFFVTGKNAEYVSGVKGAKACATFTAGTLWPYKFILHLTKSMLATGKVNLQTNTPVTSVTPAPSGGYTVTTPRGTTHAKKVVYANNAYVAGLLPQYKKAIVPCKGNCCHITVPAGKQAPLLSNSYIIREDDGTLAYLIPRIDGSIVVGGANLKYKPRLDEWYNTVDDSAVIPTGASHFDNYMQDLFHGWEDSGAKVDSLWTGVMGYSWDSNPHVGALPLQQGESEEEEKGQFVLAGFNGHGMPVIWLAARGVAKMVAEDAAFKDTGVPRLFETTRERIEAALTGVEGGDILSVN